MLPAVVVVGGAILSALCETRIALTRETQHICRQCRSTVQKCSRTKPQPLPRLLISQETTHVGQQIPSDHVLLRAPGNQVTPMTPRDELAFRALVDRVRNEFLEMPGLRLTLPQATLPRP